MSSGGCFICGSVDHIKRDCPQNNSACYVCGRPGHMARECRNAPGGGFGGAPAGDVCYNCNGVGHRARDCPSAPGVGGRGGGRGFGGRPGGFSGGRGRPSPYSTQRRSSGNPSRRVYVGNLSYSTSWQNLKDHFKQIGPVEHAEILTSGADPRGRSKGCGIVEMASSADAERAIQELTNTELDGRQIFVREDREPAGPSYPSASPGGFNTGLTRANQLEPLDPTCVVYVSHIPYRWTWQDLKDYFREAGDVMRANVLEDRSGRSSGVGHVEFRSYGDAKNAVDLLNGRNVDGLILDVHFDKKLNA